MFVVLSLVIGLGAEKLSAVCACSLLNAEELSRRFENHAVNDLFGQMHRVEVDPTIITGLGLLQGNEQPVLLFHRITAPLVIAGLVGLVVQFGIGVVKPLAEQGATRRATDNGVGIVMG